LICHRRFLLRLGSPGSEDPLGRSQADARPWRNWLGLKCYVREFPDEKIASFPALARVPTELPRAPATKASWGSDLFIDAFRLLCPPPLRLDDPAPPPYFARKLFRPLFDDLKPTFGVRYFLPSFPYLHVWRRGSFLAEVPHRVWGRNESRNRLRLRISSFFPPCDRAGAGRREVDRRNSFFWLAYFAFSPEFFLNDEKIPSPESKRTVLWFGDSALSFPCTGKYDASVHVRRPEISPGGCSG